jgi:hypothetical protein
MDGHARFQLTVRHVNDRLPDIKSNQRATDVLSTAPDRRQAQVAKMPDGRAGARQSAATSFRDELVPMATSRRCFSPTSSNEPPLRTSDASRVKNEEPPDPEAGSQA